MQFEHVTLSGERLLLEAFPAHDRDATAELLRAREAHRNGLEALLGAHGSWERSMRRYLERTAIDLRGVDLSLVRRLAQDLDERDALQETSSSKDLDQADREVAAHVESILQRIGTQARLAELLHTRQLLRPGGSESAGSAPSLSKISRILSGEVPIQARELIALLAATGQTLRRVERADGSAEPDLLTPSFVTTREEELLRHIALLRDRPRRLASRPDVDDGLRVEVERTFGWLPPDERELLVGRMREALAPELQIRSLDQPLTKLADLVEWLCQSSPRALLRSGQPDSGGPVSAAFFGHWRLVVPAPLLGSPEPPRLDRELARARRMLLAGRDFAEPLIEAMQRVFRQLCIRKGGIAVSRKLLEADAIKSVVSGIRDVMVSAEDGENEPANIEALLVTDADCTQFTTPRWHGHRWTFAGALPTPLTKRPILLFVTEQRIREAEVTWGDLPVALLHAEAVRRAWSAVLEGLGCVDPDWVDTVGRIAATANADPETRRLRPLAAAPAPRVKDIQTLFERHGLAPEIVQTGPDAFASPSLGSIVMGRRCDHLLPCSPDILTHGRRVRLMEEMKNNNEWSGIRNDFVALAAPEALQNLARLVGALVNPAGNREWDVREVLYAIRSTLDECPASWREERDNGSYYQVLRQTRLRRAS